MVDFESIDFLVNFETDDIADVMVGGMFDEEREEYLLRRKNGELTEAKIEAESLWDDDKKAYYSEDYQESSDEDRVLQCLKDEELSIDALTNSTAIISKEARQLSITFETNQKKYRATFLDFLDRDIYFQIVNSFAKPLKVQLYDVAPQFGGVIDKNYGIKFMIRVL